MKRTATTLALLAGFGGGCVGPGGSAPKEPVAGFGTTTKGRQMPGLQGPNGEPIVAARGAAPTGDRVQQASLFRKYGTTTTADYNTVAQVPGTAGTIAWANHTAPGGFGGPGGYGPPPGGGGYPGLPGILPTPGMGPSGAVAGFGALVPGMGGGATGALTNGRASINFTGPAGMKVTWQTPGGGFNDESSGLTAPAPYNFVQGQVYRLRLTRILPNHPGKSFYPTLEIAAGNPKTLKFLAHSSVPVTFTNDDFDHAVAGNMVVKVVYLPDRDNQDFLTVAGAEEVNSTRLEPGLDPVAEAQRKGSVLAIITLGNIDLENRASPAMTAPPNGGVMVLPPGYGPPPGMGALPPGTSNVGGPIAPTRPGTATLPASPTAPLAPAAPGPLPPTMNGTVPPAALPPVK